MTFAILALALLLPLLPLFEFQRPATGRNPANPNAGKAHLADNSTLLEVGRAAKLHAPPARQNELKVISYNMRWRSGKELKELIRLFREDPEIGKAAIIALQEVDRKKLRSGKANTAKLLADKLGLHYAWAAPPTAKAGSEEETGVALLSAYALHDICRVVLPHPGPGRRRRVGLGATIDFGGVPLRVYSVHAETRISMDEKLEQFESILSELKQHSANGPAIIMGDLNTWQADAERKTIKLFSDEGFETPFGAQKTFFRRVLFVPIKLRLDWIWLRGLEAVTYGIDRKINVSDHWPLWTNVRIATD